MNYGQCLSYLMGTFGKMSKMFFGLSFYTKGGLGASAKLLNNSSPRLDLTNSVNRIYDAWGATFWFSAIAAILTSIIDMTDGSVLGLIFTVIGYGICILVLGAFILLSERAQKKWVSGLVSVIIILVYISLLGSAVSIIRAVISLIKLLVKARFVSAISKLISLCSLLFSVLCTGVEMTALLQGVPCENPLGTTSFSDSLNNFGNDLNNSLNTAFNGNQGVQNYGPNGTNPMAGAVGAAGLAGLGALNNTRDATIDVQGSVQNNIQNNSQGNIDLNKQEFQNNQSVTDNQSATNNQNVQLFACPYCGNALHQGENPCPNCHNTLNW